QAAHLLGGRRLDLTNRVVECRHEQVLQHFAVGRQGWVDAHPPHLVLAGHHDLHHGGARLALHFNGAKLLLHAAHVFLHHLRLLHHLADIAFHGCFSRIVESTTLPSKRLTRSCTKLSPFTARVAWACRAPRSAASIAEAVAPRSSPGVTRTFTGEPRCAASP